MSFSHNRLNLTPGSLYVDKLAVRHILPIDRENNEYSTNTIFAVAVNGELEGYNPVTWFSSIGYTDPSTIQGELVSSTTALYSAMYAADQSTVAGLAEAGYVSTGHLTSTVAGLTTTTPVSLSLFYGTLAALAESPYNYVSSSQLASTVAGLGQAGYVSTGPGGLLTVSALASRNISTGNLTTSTVLLRDIITSTEAPLYSQNGSLYYNGVSLAGSMNLDVTSVKASAYVSTATLNTQKLATPRQLMVGGSTGSIQTSTGASWTTAASLFSGLLGKLYYVRGRWYAVGYDSGYTNTLKYSANGTSWTSINTFDSDNVVSFAYNGTTYMVGTNTDKIYTSSDGQTWTETTNSVGVTSVNALLYTGSRWLCGGAGPSIKYSDDGGASWTTASGTVPDTTYSFSKNASVIVAVGDTSNKICYSTDNGLSWTAAAVTFTGSVNNVVWTTAYFVAGGNDGAGTSPIKYSRDGRTWFNSSGIGVAETVNSVFWNGTKTYTATTASIYESTDYGRTWTSLAAQPTVGTNVAITYSVEDRDDLVMNNATLYNADIPHYYNSTNQIYGAADKIVLNDTLNIRVGTIGIMKGDPSADYHLDVAGAVNASTIYISSAQFNDSTAGGRVGVDIAGGMLRVGGVPAFQSTVAGLGGAGYVSSSGLASTVAGLGSAGYVSTSGLTSTVAGLGQVYVSTSGLTSTVAGLGQIYMSTDAVTSTLSYGLTSTVSGLGSASYVSTSGLTSTVAGLGEIYVSTSGLTSTVAGLGEIYVSTSGLTSTVAGLGQIYMSTNAVTSTLSYGLTSTVAGLGSASYVSTSGLTSTVAGLGQIYLSSAIGLVSTPNLTSTVAGLGQIYLSSAIGLVSTPNLTSTVAGLGQIYLSSLLFDNGTSATPSISFKSDQDTGIYRQSANEMRFVTGSVDRMVIDASGRVGIGTSNLDGSRLSLLTNGNYDWTQGDGFGDINIVNSARTIGLGIGVATAGVGAGNGAIWTVGGTPGVSGSLTFGTNQTERMKIDASGRVIIGSPISANYRLTVNQDTLPGAISVIGVIDNARNRAANGDSNGAAYGFFSNEDLGMYRAAADTLAFTTAGGERLRIDASGRVGIGTTIPSYTLDVSGSFYASTINYAKLFTSTIYVGNNNRSTNSIRFYGTYSDETPLYANTVIAENIYAAPENSELLLFKGNDYAGSFGPDRIRHFAGAHQFDILSRAPGGETTWKDGSGVPVAGISAALYIDSSGYVGINNATPLKPLDIFGQMRFAQYTTETNGPEPAFILYNNKTNFTGNYLALHTGLGLNSYSGIVESGDKGIIYDQTGFVVAPWLTNGGGIRLDNSGNLFTYFTNNRALWVENIGGDSRILLNPAIGANQAEIKRWNTANGHFDLINYGGGAINISANGLGPYNGISILSDGSVGIGKTNPIFRLDVSGNGRVTGSFSKQTGTFDIEHPIIPNKRLVHSFIEGPRCDNIYRGEIQLINGSAIVNLDKDCVKQSDCAMTEGTFEALCANPMVYLQNNETFDRVKGTINGNKLHIICENTNSSAKINWLVIGERKDKSVKSWERTNEEGYLITEYNPL